MLLLQKRKKPMFSEEKMQISTFSKNTRQTGGKSNFPTDLLIPLAREHRTKG